MMSKDKIAEAYREYLAQQGYRPETTSDGMVSFKYQGRFYYIAADEQDPQFFRLIYPNIYQIKDESDRDIVLEAVGRATGNVRTGKVIVVNDQVWVCSELFVTSIDHAAVFFEPCLSIVDEAAQRFLQEMQQA